MACAPVYETRPVRIQRDIKHIASLGKDKAGRTCFTYSQQDKDVRDFLIETLQGLNLSIAVDGVGNIRARYEGKNPDAPIVMSGSHIDSVRQGGKFDGVAGVVAALEVVRTMVDEGIVPIHPVEVVIFSEEEGSNFGPCCAGSKTMIGRYTVKDLKKLKNPAGMSMYTMAQECGYNPDSMPNSVLRPGDVKAFLELHIEQGPSLDAAGVPIGIVEAINGLRQMRVDVQGVANHAGGTPMALRQDSLLAASRMILAVEEIVRKEGANTTVGTVGHIECSPNVWNIIPGRATFSIDIRDVCEKTMDRIVEKVKERIQDIATACHVESRISSLASLEAVRLSPQVIEVLEKKAKELGTPYKKINSGAVHDAVLLRSITDVGMIFVPSIGGRSHCPEEETDVEDIKKGADILLASILELAGFAEE